MLTVLARLTLKKKRKVKRFTFVVQFYSTYKRTAEPIRLNASLVSSSKTGNVKLDASVSLKQVVNNAWLASCSRLTMHFV
jgi:hypothetical protein